MNPIIPQVLANEHCSNCILSKNAKLVDVRNRTLEINNQYVPCEINTLLVAESPPTSFCEQPTRYFYASGIVKFGTLFYHIMKTLFEEEMNSYKIKPKDYFLSMFKDNGYYLIDMAKCPVDKLSDEDKSKALATCSNYLRKELKTLQYQRVIFIGKGSFKRIKAHLDLNLRPQVVCLPFGSQRNAEAFKIELSKSLRAQRCIVGSSQT